MEPNRTEILIGILLLCLMLTFFSFMSSENKWQSKVSLLNNELSKLKNSYNTLIQNADDNKKTAPDKSLDTTSTNSNQEVKTTSAFFLKENNKYVLYLGDPEGEKKASGLSIDILQAYTDNGLENIKPTWQISPDGKKIVYLSNNAPGYTGRLANNGVLRISDLDGKNDQVLYIQSGSLQVGLSQFFWTKDSNAVYLLTSITDEGGYSYYLSLVDINTKEVTTNIANDSKFTNPNDDTNTEYQNVPIY